MRLQVASRRWVVPLVAVFSARAAMAAPTVLDFEDIPAPATIRTQYSPRGVLFNFAFLSKGPLFSPNTVPRSGTQVLRVSNPSTQGEFSPNPMIITFTSPQSRVRMFAGSDAVASTGTLRAFDANGVLVGTTDGPKTVAADVFTTEFEITVPTPSIARVELLYDNAAFEAIDDLEFEGEAPAPPPPTPPVVQITSPVNGADLDVSTIDIAGTVTGPGLLSPVTLIIEERRPPASTAPPFTSALELTGSGTSRPFSLPGFGTLGFGPIKITIEAENTGGLKGTASVSITNLPAAIRARFAAEGGAGVFGEFRFGFFGTGCKVAIYELGAISTDGAGVTRLIRGAILLKWLASLGPFDECPLGEEREGPPQSRVQDFQGGRIYTSTQGTFLVPAVFVDAIGTRGGEAATGVPIADPTKSVGVMQTWLFQRFTRLDRPDLLPSTLEIRGTPPTLWMERQEGDLSVPLALSDLAKSLGRFPATIWESFPCDGLLGPCSVEPEPPFPPANTPDAGDRFCGGSTYIPTLEGLVCCPPEWVAIRGDRVVTPVFGAIVSAHLTDIDNGLTHETHNGTCPFVPEAVGGDLTCVSDYEFFVRPIGPQVNTNPLPSLFGKSNTTKIKTEYEVFYAAVPHNFMGAPVKGDLVHTTGRWIIDCGHDTFKSELHPIFSYAKMATHSSEINVFTGIVEPLSFLDPGQQATRADIWVTGWYPGGQGNDIEFDIFPPPRPSPDSLLTLVRPPDADAVQGDISVEFTFEPPGAASHIHVRFKAPRRENVVTEAGEMKWEYGRRYVGKWYAFWD